MPYIRLTTLRESEVTEKDWGLLKKRVAEAGLKWYKADFLEGEVPGYEIYPSSLPRGLALWGENDHPELKDWVGIRFATERKKETSTYIPKGTDLLEAYKWLATGKGMENGKS